MEVEDFKFSAQNIHGLSQEKIDIMKEYILKFHMYIFSETWAEDSKMFSLEGYEYYPFSRAGKHVRAWKFSGGQGIFLRRDIIKGVEFTHSIDDVIVWIKLKKTFFNLDRDFLIASIYVYPENSTCIEYDHYQTIQQEICNLDIRLVDHIIIGDGNARTKLEIDYVESYEDGSDGPLVELLDNNPHDQIPVYDYLNRIGRLKRRSLDTKPMNAYGHCMLNLCKTSNMFILNGRSCESDVGYHTRIETTGCSLVDYLVTTPRAHEKIKYFAVGPKFPESDHLPLEVTIGKCVPKNNISSNINWKPMYKYRWNKDNLPRLQRTLSDEQSVQSRDKFLGSIINLDHTEYVTHNFINYFQQACSRTFTLQQVKYKNNIKPMWFDKECADKRLDIINTNRMLTSDSQQNEIKDKCKQYRAMKQRKKRQQQFKNSNAIENTFQNKPAEIWKLLTNLSRNSEKNGLNGEDFFKHYETLSKPPVDITFNDEFEKEVNGFLDSYDNNASSPPVVNSKELEVLNAEISEDEVSSAIDSLKNNKSCGIDAIPGEFLKICKDVLSPDITTLFNYFIETEHFPDVWTEGIRTSLHKAGSTLDPNNYRGITVLPIFEKIFEIIVHKRLEFIDEAFRRKDRYNGGFVRGSQTSDNLFILRTLIERALILNQVLIIIFVDFCKAFDLMNRKIAFYKMIKSGLHGRVINTLRNLYSKTSIRIKDKGKLSEKILQLVGVNQGGNASPMIFRKYMEDLRNYMHQHTGVALSQDELLAYLLWADDLICASGRVPDAQKQLDGLSVFCSKNRSFVNTIKTKYMAFGNVGKIRLFFNGTEIKRVGKYKYLGNMVREINRAPSDPFTLNYEYLCNKARGNIFSLLSKLKNVSPVYPKLRIYLFDRLIRPVLTYGSGVWGVSEQGRKEIDKIHLWYIRMVLGIKKNSSIYITLGDSGSLPPSLDVTISCINFAIRLEGMEHTQHDSLVYKAFKESVRLHNLGFNTWYSKTCQLAQRHNISLNIRHNKNTIKQKIHNEFIQDWKQSIQDLDKHPLLRTYVHIKSEYRIEPFLTMIKNSKHRTALARFRASSHTLEIERGRHSRPITPVENRLCSECKLVENEIHFLTQCKIFDTERMLLYQQISQKFPDFSALDSFCKFQFMLTFNDENLLNLVAKFVYNGLEKRKLISTNSSLSSN